MADDSPPLARVYQLSDPTSDLRRARDRVSEALRLLDAAQDDLGRAVRRGRGGRRATGLPLLALGAGQARYRATLLLRELERELESSAL